MVTIQTQHGIFTFIACAQDASLVGRLLRDIHTTLKVERLGQSLPPIVTITMHLLSTVLLVLPAHVQAQQAR